MKHFTYINSYYKSLSKKFYFFSFHFIDKRTKAQKVLDIRAPEPASLATVLPNLLFRKLLLISSIHTHAHTCTRAHAKLSS